MRIRRQDGLPAFVRTVADEQDRALAQNVGKAFRVNDFRLSFARLAAISIENGSIDLHPSRIYHRDNVLAPFRKKTFPDSLPDESVQRANGDQRYPRAEAQALGSRYTHTETGI